MSNTSNEQENAASPGKAPRLISLLLAGSLGLFVGGLAGVLVAGPVLAERAVARAEAVAENVVAEVASGGHEKGKKEKTAKAGEHGEIANAPVYTLDNLVLNPAQSGGSRFLVASLALAVRDDPVLELIKQRDAEVRDAVLRVLGGKTVGQLSDMGARPELKHQLQLAVDSLFGAEVVSGVFFPQFVIQ